VLFTTNPAGGCGGLINLTSIQSKSFRTQQAATYQPFEECHWTIITSPAKSVIFTIDSIDIKNSLNNNTQRDKCSGDYLEVSFLRPRLISIFRKVDNKIVYRILIHIIVQKKR